MSTADDLRRWAEDADPRAAKILRRVADEPSRRARVVERVTSEQLRARHLPKQLPLFPKEAT